MAPEITRIINSYGWRPTFLTIDESLIELEGIDRPTTSFSAGQLDDLKNQGESSWWYVTRNQIIHRAILNFGNRKTLWDIGAGTGEVSSYLIARGVETVCVEPSRSGAILSASRGITSIACDLSALRLPDDSIGQIGMFDVLEHVEDRTDFLKEVRRVTQPGGRVFVTVPALKVLWGQMDNDVGHFVRYTRRSVVREFRNAGFDCVHVRYFFGLLVIPILLLRALPFRLGIQQPISDSKLLKSKTGVIRKILGRFESRYSQYLPFGSSLLLVARKPD